MKRLRVIALAGALVIAGSSATAQTRAPMPALVSGQSNARYLAPHLPPGSHILVAESGQSILRWDWLDTGASGALGRAFLDVLGRYRFSVFVWWQGDSDAQMSAAEYERRLVTLLNAAQVPVMVVEILYDPSIHTSKPCMKESRCIRRWPLFPPETCGATATRSTSKRPRTTL